MYLSATPISIMHTQATSSPCYAAHGYVSVYTADCAYRVGGAGYFKGFRFCKIINFDSSKVTLYRYYTCVLTFLLLPLQL